MGRANVFPRQWWIAQKTSAIGSDLDSGCIEMLDGGETLKAKIETKIPKEWTSPEGQIKKFYEVTVEGIPKKYGCWQFEKLAAINIGDEIEFTETEKAGRWSMTLAGTAPKGGGFQSRGKSPEELKQQLKSFSSAYAKDVTVAFINQGTIKDSKAADASILHYSNLFSGLIGG